MRDCASSFLEAREVLEGLCADRVGERAERCRVSVSGAPQMRVRRAALCAIVDMLLDGALHLSPDAEVLLTAHESDEHCLIEVLDDAPVVRTGRQRALERVLVEEMAAWVGLSVRQRHHGTRSGTQLQVPVPEFKRGRGRRSVPPATN